MRLLTTLLLGLFLGLATTAQINPNQPVPKPKPSTAPAKPAGPKQFSGNSSILVVIDADCTLKVDYQLVGNFKAGDTWLSPIMAGSHIVECSSVTDRWEGIAECKTGQQLLLRTELATVIGQRVDIEDRSRIAKEKYQQALALFHNNQFGNAHLLFDEAASLGSLNARFYSGYLKEWGIGSKQDRELAQRIYEEGSVQGDPLCIFKRAEFLFNGANGVQRDSLRSVSMGAQCRNGLEMRFRGGEKIAAVLLMITEERLLRDRARALSCLTTLRMEADSSATIALFLGQYTFTGVLKHDNLTEEERVGYLVQASDMSHPRAMSVLADLYLNGSASLPTDTAKAEPLLLHSSQLGYGYANAQLAWIARARQSWDRMFTLSIKAKDLGFEANVVSLLVNAYYSGRGVPEDKNEALAYALRYPENSFCLRILGLCHEYGFGGATQDQAKALYYFGMAAARGDEYSQTRLGTPGHQ